MSGCRHGTVPAPAGWDREKGCLWSGLVTLRNPETSLTFIDRFIASAEAYSVDTILVFNKLDILDKKDNNELQHIVELYEKIGYRCIKTIATQDIGLTEIKAAISGKIALLSGNSGVGKSTALPI